MTKETYAIRKAFVVPLGIDALLLLSLLAIALFGTGETTEQWFFGLLTLLGGFLFLENLVRRAVVTDEGLSVRTLWRRKRVLWKEITHVGCLSLPRRIYLLLTTTRGIIILSSAYEAFPRLKEAILQRVEPDRVEEEVRRMGGKDRASFLNILLAWVAAAFMIGIIVTKVHPSAF